ncbi:MAG TPA: YfhO family protein [Pyrinomonadaceae bacterium]|nr:YfhO family protein [Pyrinomonadaceae bacterium]
MNRSLSPRFSFSTDKLAAAAITLAPVLYFLPALLAHLVLGPDDGVLFNIPLRVTTANLLRAGELPIWNPYIFGGMPLFATAQGGLLFPLNWIYLLFSPAVATNMMVIATYMVAGLGAYLFARKTGSSVAGAVVTGLIWQMGGFLVAQISHINIAHTAALLPWTLWSLERYVETGSRRRGALLAVLVAVQIFAGHQQTFAYTFLLFCVYAIVMAFGNERTRKRYLLSLGFAIAGVMLAAIQIVPTFELLENSIRSEATYDFFSSFSMPPSFIATYLAPYIMGGGDGRLFRAPYIGQAFYTEYVSYASILGVMLAVTALLLKPDRRTRLWAAVVIAGLALAFGRFLPLNVYRVVYYVPILNLFRVPARHLVEVHFAVAMLAGRGLTAISWSPNVERVKYRVATVAIGVFLLTWSIVTWLRPASFRLVRDAPVTLLRAPELFMPLVFATLSAWAIWAFANRWRGATASLVAVLALDLFLWGQFSGWYPSAKRIPAEYWGTPESVELLRSIAPADRSSYRILTSHQSFKPNSSVHTSGWLLWTEPDIYSMFGISNVAGYDGFGLERYSELAGQMKLWGELTDPNATLRSNSREIDLLNARYLIARHDDAPEPIVNADDVAPPSAFPDATETYANLMFSREDLALSNINSRKLLRLRVPPVKVDHIAIVSNLSWADQVPDGAAVAHLKLNARDGRVFEFDLRAGTDTADWSYDRPDIRARIKHSRAAVATSFDLSDSQYKYEGHTYLASFALPDKAIIESGQISIDHRDDSPDLFLSISHVSLIDTKEQKTYAMGRDMFTIENTVDTSGSRVNTDRWRHVAKGRHFDIYENGRALPRAWMTSDVQVLNGALILQVIRTGVLPDGSKWDPLRTALVESAVPGGPTNSRETGKVTIKSYGASRIDLSAEATNNSFLVLAENDYPGWRAYIDGQSTEVIRTNYALRGLVIPSGQHQIVFVYRPWSIIGGLLVSLLTAAGLILIVRRKPNSQLQT